MSSIPLLYHEMRLAKRNLYSALGEDKLEYLIIQAVQLIFEINILITALNQHSYIRTDYVPFEILIKWKSEAESCRDYGIEKLKLFEKL